jgi:hypothetical protein
MEKIQTLLYNNNKEVEEQKGSISFTENKYLRYTSSTFRLSECSRTFMVKEVGK